MHNIIRVHVYGVCICYAVENFLLGGGIVDYNWFS